MLAAAQQHIQLPASMSTSGKSLGLGIGAWPAPAPRSTGYPRDLVRGSGSPSPPADPVSENVQISRPKLAATKPVARVAGPPKGTMELMSKPYQRRPETSVQSKASTRSGSPVKSQLSAWELRMEKAMAEDAPATTAKASTRPQASRKKSIPPHLRSKPDEIIKAAHQKPVTLSLNPNAKVYEVAAKQEETVQDDVDILEDSIVALQVAMDIPGIQNSKDVSLMQALLSICVNILRAYACNKNCWTGTSSITSFLLLLLPPPSPPPLLPRSLIAYMLIMPPRSKCCSYAPWSTRWILRRLHPSESSWLCSALSLTATVTKSALPTSTGGRLWDRHELYHIPSMH